LKTEIWDVLEKEDFAFKSLLVLENLQVLERCGLLPFPSTLLTGKTVTFGQDTLRTRPTSTSCSLSWFQMWGLGSTCRHGVSVTWILVRAYDWQHVDIFTDNPAEFSSLFRRILSMTLDTTLSATIRTHILSFIISAFQSLDSGIVRKECAPLVSISIWHNISSEKKRERKLDQSVQLRKAWRAAAKRYDASDEPTKPRLRFERSWLFTLILDFFNQLYNEKSKPGSRYLPILWLVIRMLTSEQKISGIASASSSFCQTSRASYQLGDMSIHCSRTWTLFLLFSCHPSSIMRIMDS